MSYDAWKTRSPDEDLGDPANYQSETRVKIKTTYWAKPIPDRSFDWEAVTDNYDGARDSNCPIGFGRTEAEAVADLLDQLEP